MTRWNKRKKNGYDEQVKPPAKLHKRSNVVIPTFLIAEVRAKYIPPMVKMSSMNRQF
jgi:hypothetical protein